MKDNSTLGNHPIRAVLFDAVGTLLHPQPGAPEVYSQVAIQFGIHLDPRELLARFRQAYSVEEQLDQAADWATSEEREYRRWKNIVQHIFPTAPEACFDRLYQHFAAPEAWLVPPEAGRVFDFLTANNIRMGLASNYDSRLESVLRGRFELDPIREHVFISSSMGIRKPHPNFFLTAARTLGFESCEVLMVGDDFQNDYQGALRANMPAVLLDPADRFPDVPDRVANLSELIQRIEPMNRKV